MGFSLPFAVTRHISVPYKAETVSHGLYTSDGGLSPHLVQTSPLSVASGAVSTAQHPPLPRVL
jgi:hypothetical protein